MAITEITNLSEHRQYQLMSMFNIYRVALALSLLAILRFFWVDEKVPLELSRQTFAIAVGCYLVLCGVAMMIQRQKLLNQASVLVIMITDVMLLTLIMKSAGGVGSGFGNLMIVSVATGSLFMSLNNSLMLAAFASSAVVYTQLFSGLRDTSADREFLQAALLGVAFFGTTILIQYILSRVRLSEQLAEEQAENILDLQSINELILQRMRTGIIVTSRKGKIRTQNEAAKRLICNSENETIDSLPIQLRDLMYRWLANLPIDSHKVRIHPDMPEVFANFTALQDKPHSDVLIFLEDISQTTQQAQQLKLASLGRFTASIAHEIRNPLGAISHAAQLLQESPKLDETDIRMLHIIQNHSVRMNSIIENILQLSRRSKAHPEVLELEDWLKEFSTTFKQVDPGAHIELATLGSHKVRFDPSQLHQVLDNLVANGLRYSQKRMGQKLVRIESGILNANDEPFIDIVDFGPGISQENQSNLFEPFFTTENSGTGLGLFISKELCESNQSRLEFIKTLNNNEGCRFRIAFAHPGRISQIEDIVTESP